MKANLLNESGFDSKSLFKELSLQEADTLNRMQEGLNWVIPTNIDCVLIGGVAVAHYLPSARSLTPDFDFLVADIKGLKELLGNQKIDFSPLANSNGGFELGITIPKFNIDFLDANSQFKAVNHFAIKTAEQANIGGIKLKVVSPESLVIMKFGMGRDKDDKDAFALLQSGVVSRIKYLDALLALNPNIDYITLQGYSKLIK